MEALKTQRLDQSPCQPVDSAIIPVDELEIGQRYTFRQPAEDGVIDTRVEVLMISSNPRRIPNALFGVVCVDIVPVNFDGDRLGEPQQYMRQDDGRLLFAAPLEQDRFEVVVLAGVDAELIMSPATA